MTEDGIIGCCLLDDTDLMDMNLSKFWEIVKDRKPGVLQSMWLQIAGRVLALAILWSPDGKNGLI